MRIDLLAIGSQGDVQPFIALGLGLQAAGHRVRVVTLDGFEQPVRSRNLDHLSIAQSPRDIAATDSGREWVKKRNSTQGFLRGFVRVACSLIETGMADYWRASRDAQAIIVSPMGVLLGIHLAEKLGVPLMEANLAPPVVPTRYDWDGSTNLATTLKGRLNASIHTTFHLLLWTQIRKKTNVARRNILGLPPLSFTEPLKGTYRERVPLLCAYSPVIVGRVPDWGDTIHVTGYWFLDDFPGWTPPGELVDFLNAGPPPVFAGFGSTPFPQAEATTGLVVGALKQAGQRGILIAGGSGLRTGRLSENVLSLDSIPHGWLFSRVSAAVHHGGAGVTGAALRAGLPSVVVPVFADQPFWGERVSKLGAGPASIPAKTLTEDNLASAIRETAGTEMRCRAAALGEKIRGEDGVGQAVNIIHKHLGVAASQPVRP